MIMKSPVATAPGKRRRLPKVLVLAPTRELAQQIHGEAEKFAPVVGASSVCLYGGSSKFTQIRAMARGMDVVIGTPGRCNDLLQSGELDLSEVSYFVLDEADRMLDMGFEPQIQSIINYLNPSRQNLFFTATWPKEVQGLARSYLSNPVTVAIGDRNSLNANKNIAQHIHLVSSIDKNEKLEEILRSLSSNPTQVPKTLIFVARKSDCDSIGLDLRSAGYPVGTLHGDKLQTAREIIMSKFRNSSIKVLVATDVAARGLDVKVPRCYYTYIYILYHRNILIILYLCVLGY
jgi:ATP-dependent RNA helicase DDX5/DBP2